MCIGLVDMRTHKFFEWNVKHLVHLNVRGLRLFETDFQNEEGRFEDVDYQILGSPMPSLFPIMLSDFFKSTYAQQKAMIPALEKYTVFPEYANMLHFLAFDDKPEFLQAMVSKANFSYLSPHYSPI